MMSRSLLAATSLLVFAAPAGAAITLKPVADGFASPMYATSDTGRSGETRMFVLEREGRVVVFDRTTGTRSTLLDISGQVVTAGEQGLLGLAFDPGYATNGRYYLHFSTQPDPAGPRFSEIHRFTDPTVTGTPEGSVTILRVQQTEFLNHKSGWIDFGPDNNLYIPLGDGGSANDPFNNGQNTSVLLGKILRIDPNGADAFPGDPNRNYAIPAGNLSGAAPEVFAYGLRNPFRNSFAPDGTLIIADVGQNAFEEVTLLLPGATDRNFGWRLREGEIATPGVGGPEPPDHVDPALVIGHDTGNRSIIGGYVYRGSLVPDLVGEYVFGDFISGNLFTVDYLGGGLAPGSLDRFGNLPSVVSFGETSDGEMLVVDLLGGRVFQLAVPEPATWGMMILGFGLVGCGLRARSRRTVIQS